MARTSFFKKFGFPESWDVELLSKLVFFQEGPGVRNHQFKDSGVKLLNVRNIVENTIDLSKTKTYISEEEAYGRYKHFLVDEGDLVIASSGIKVEQFDKKIAFVKKEHLPLCMNTSTIRFKIINKQRLDSRFLRWFLSTEFFKRQVQHHITGSAQLNFGPSHLKKMYLPLFSIEEQRRIVKTLDQADSLRQKRKQAIELLDQYLESVFLEMFGDPVTNLMGWEVEPLGQLLSFLTSGSRGWAKYYASVGDIFLRIQNVRKNQLDLTETTYVNPPATAEAKRTRVKASDVLLSITADLGRTAVVPDTMSTAYINQHLAILRLKEGINPYYLAEFLVSRGGMRQIDKLNKGGTKAGLNFNDIKSIKVPVPSLELQGRFKDAYLKTQALKQKMLVQSVELETQFQALIQKAFKGELGGNPSTSHPTIPSHTSSA